MKIWFEAHFTTDGDFGFDYESVLQTLKNNESLYKEATTNYEYHESCETIDIYLSADGEPKACKWFFRDLIESLICGIRTIKHYLVKDLYNLLIYFREDLWTSEPPITKQKGLSGNYTGTWLILQIIE